MTIKLKCQTIDLSNIENIAKNARNMPIFVM